MSVAHLPTWLQAQLHELLTRQSPALLLHGPQGLGQFDLALELARSWLCESPREFGVACGQCAACQFVASRTHPDLLVLMPEVQMLELGWPLDERAQQEIDDKKRKPSKDIRVEALRTTIEFSQLSMSRGQCKAIVLYPAERMNHVSANALLKTLEEPPGQVRFVLATEASHLLLPTIRSRCQAHRMHWPQREQALSWLGDQSAEAAQLYDAAGQRPGVALSLAQSGVSAQAWANLPKAASQGQAGPFDGMSLAAQVEVMQKICHDLWRVAVGAEPRFFPAQGLPTVPSLAALQRWQVSLGQYARMAQHPLMAGLHTQSLLAQAQAVLKSGS